jgi:protein TonB
MSGNTLHFTDSDQILRGWAISAVLHCVIVAAAVTLVPKMTLVIEREPFKWDVALVEPMRESLREDVPPPVAKVQPPRPAPVEPVRPQEPLPETVTARVAPQQSPQMVHPVVEPLTPKEPVQPIQEIARVRPKPVEPEIVKPQEPVQPVQEVSQVQPKPVEPEVVKQQEVKEPEPVVKEVVQQDPVKETIREVAPVVEPVNPTTTYQAPTQVASRPPAESPSQPAAAEVAPIAHAAPPPSAPSAATVPEGPPPVPSIPTVKDQPPVGTNVPAPRAATKADYAWLAESLGRRIAALTRYPNSARMNGWEGRVVLRAVIRADGHLAEVTIKKSSGYEALDQAALETIKLACPLHMKHQLSTTQVAINVPIVYSLSN